MNDDRQKNSDLDLNKILEEYSAINRESVRSSDSGSQYGRQESSSSYNDVPISKNNSAVRRNTENLNAPAKKFVLHIDETVIDSADNEPVRKPQNNSGIYFSNYQKKSNTTPNGNRNNTTANGAPVAKPTTQSNNKSVSVKKNIGSRAALIFLAIIIGATSILSYIGISCIGDMLAINRSEESIEVTIPEDAKYTEVIDILHDNDLIKNKLFCKLFTQYRHFDDDTYLSGKYYLSSSMGLEGMLKDMMVAPITADTIKLSFPEGWTVQQIFEKLEKNDVCESNKLYSTIRSNYSYDFFAEIEDNNKRYLKLEGYLFPDTYDFFVGADTNYVIKKFLDNFESKWTPEYQARADKLGYSCDEIIIIASIIQKEAANSEQMKTISSVIHNRLNNGARFPTLGCDSTALYVTNYVTPVVGDAAGLNYYSYYDTRSNKGLPPGPICNPGMDAIKAALYPETTKYFFFAHDNSGKIYLAETLDGHNTNLVKIIKANNQN
ncbi:MAG: endolytic transglycosylase MltG [Clostridia bacterium]|nr:endolytic transglycosylase MltG [Clostridia bacterium]